MMLAQEQQILPFRPHLPLQFHHATLAQAILHAVFHFIRLTHIRSFSVLFCFGGDFQFAIEHNLVTISCKSPPTLFNRYLQIPNPFLYMIFR